MASGDQSHILRLDPDGSSFLWIPETSDLLALNDSFHEFGIDSVLAEADSAVDAAAAGKMPLNRDAVELEADEPVRISALNLNLTPRCNLACVYCYAAGGDYSRLSSDLDFRTVVSAMGESSEMLDRKRGLRFEFFGGEPMLNPQAIEDALNWEREFWSERYPDSPVVNRISTNLTHLDDRGIELLRRGNFIVSVSIDGTEAIQNTQRPYKSGRGSFDEIVANVTRLKSLAPELVTVARMTVHGEPGVLDQEADALSRLGIFDFCSIYPSAHRARDEQFRREVSKGFIGLGKSYSNWSFAGDGFKGCLEVDRYLGHILNGTAAANHCRAGNGYFSLSPDSTVHPCHRLIGDSSHQVAGGLGSVGETPGFWNTPVTRRPECSNCPYRYLCGGGCKQENMLENCDPLKPGTGVCWFGELLFFSSAWAFSVLGADSREKVAGMAADLEKLFVFCGQKSVDPGSGARHLVRQRLSHLVNPV